MTNDPTKINSGALIALLKVASNPDAPIGALVDTTRKILPNHTHSDTTEAERRTRVDEQTAISMFALAVGKAIAEASEQYDIEVTW